MRVLFEAYVYVFQWWLVNFSISLIILKIRNSKTRKIMSLLIIQQGILGTNSFLLARIIFLNKKKCHFFFSDYWWNDLVGVGKYV